MQVVRIKQTIEKVLDNDKYLAKRILTLFRDQNVTIIPALTALPMTFLAIALTVTDVFGGRGGPATSGSPKDEETINKWLNRLTDALKKHAGKATELLPAIMGSVAGDL